MEACAYIEENIDKNWVGANTPFFMRNFWPALIP
jgi:hypothetical protein